MAGDSVLVGNSRRPRFDPWSAGAVLIAAAVLLPVLSVVWIAFHPTENAWPHLISTTLPRYLGNTLIMMAGTGILAGAMGTGAAWLVVMYRFPGQGWLQWALLLPLAVPGYVGAYALVDFLAYAGPVQGGLRALFGWTGPRDYWFPPVRSRGAGIVVLGAAFYPYVYLLARAAFREQSGAGYEVARALGIGPWGRFLRVGLRLARPAIAAGIAVVMMETVADFGAMDHFAVQTLTTGIFGQWRQAGNLGAAAQLSLVTLGLITMLVTLEKLGRRRSRHSGSARGLRPVVPQRVTGLRGAVMTALVALPFLLGFVLPVAVLAGHALDPADWVAPGLLAALWHSLSVGAVASGVTVALGLFMVYGVRLSGRRLPVLLLPVTAIGYAAPGAVLGIGILIPLAAFDHRVADLILAVTGRDPGLILTGSAGALVIACVVRFFAIAQGTADAALGRISPSLPMAARSLGRAPGAVLREVHLPLIRTSVGSALLLVFVDCVKELPATLLLRPFNYDTLATRVQVKASLESLSEAAPAALTITLVGLVAVAFLARTNR
ncbi:MAG: iron ABC transporter permease [Rubellimicrobium sp.]|nr:iron ABC transporter permease [Rubellimicrobium sp.]